MMLKVRDLSFGFGSRRLFADLSFDVKPGQLVHIAGSNGVGKSTLLGILAGTIAPLSGSVDYTPVQASENKSRDSAGDPRQYIEYLPAEANGLYLAMSAQENLAFWQRLRHGATEGSDEITQALAAWNLNQPWLTLGFPVSKFSTGMKRRLALVRLSLAKVPCWLLDEPVYGLDEQAIHSFRMMLQAHLSAGGMAVMVSHDLSALRGLEYQTVTLGARGTGS
jgi:heme exporter protein A